jgi:V/A-type H+-transporting ATPase subunit K
MIKRKMAFISVFVFQMMAAVLLIPGLLHAAEVAQAAAGKESAGWGYIGAGIAVGLACIGSSYAVGRIGSAGIGAVTEKPELMGKTLVFLGLAEGIAIYGLIIAVMILNKI